VTSAAAHLARVFGGEAHGSRILAPGPGHSQRDRSMSVTFDIDAPDGFLVHSFSNNSWQECRDYVKTKLGLPHSSVVLQNAMPTITRVVNNNTTLLAQKILQEACSIKASPVEDYLISRGIGLVPEAYDVLRYHCACPFKGEFVPAMIAPMVDVHSNEFRGVHRTRLKPKDKGMLGRAKCAVLKLSCDDGVTSGLFICEGIETGLALLSMGFKPLWACLSAGGIAKFPVLPGIEALTIFSDNDINQTGQNAALEGGSRWLTAGKEVNVFATPEPGTDFADWKIP